MNHRVELTDRSRSSQERKEQDSKILLDFITASCVPLEEREDVDSRFELPFGGDRP